MAYSRPSSLRSKSSDHAGAVVTKCWRHTPDADVHHGLNVLFNELLCTYKFALLVILASYLSFTRECIVSRVVDICDYGLLFIVRESLYIDVLKINVDMVSFACNYCAS